MPVMAPRRKKPVGWAKRIEALIARIGEKKVMSLTCCTARALKGWRYGEWEPSPAHQKLIEMAEKDELK